MLSSNSQHKIHRLEPRRKVKSGSLADISRGDKDSKSSSSGAAVESIANGARVGSFATMKGGLGVGPVTASSIHPAGGVNVQRAQVTPDKSPKPQLQDDLLSSSSDDDESEDERTKLISEIDFFKLSPGINPHTMSNYELLRLRNIQRNEAKLASLGLVGMTSKKPAAKKPPPKKSTPARQTAARNSPYVFKTSASQAWHTRHLELLSHVVRGVLTVPPSNKSLHGWIRRQKAQYQKYKYGEKSTLDEEKARLLLDVAPEQYWLGICKSPGAVAAARPAKKTKRESDDVDSIGSQDSYSEDELYLPHIRSTPKKRKTNAVQRELEGLRSPQWMDGFDDAKNDVVQRKSDYFDASDDGKYKPKSSAQKIVAEKRDSKRYSREKRRANRDLSDDESIEYRRHKKRSDDFSDEESVHGARRRNNIRSSKQRSGRRLVKDYYSDDDINLDELRSRRVSSSKPACNGSRRGEAPKPRRATIKSSLEMLDAAAAPPTNQLPSKQSNTDLSKIHRPSKRKGVVSEEPERPRKRLRRDYHRKKYTRNGYDSESSSSYSDDRSSSASYSSTSVSAASTHSSSLYGPNKPMNEVLITQQTKTLTTRNQRNDEFKAQILKRHELMQEYKYIYARNMERFQSLSKMVHEMQSLEAKLIQNGNCLFDTVESTEQLMLGCKAHGAELIDGTLMSPAELERRGANAGLVETSLSGHGHAGMIEDPALRDEMKAIEWI